MKLQCVETGLTIAAGAAAAFFAACGYLYRCAYVAGYAAGRGAAVQTFRNIINAANARKIYTDALPELRALFDGDAAAAVDTDADTDGTQ